MNQKEISLADANYFEIFIGTRVLQEDVFNLNGDIPVYSANVFKPFGYLNSSNIEDFSYDYLLWGIDGDFKFNLIRKGTRFATTDHCGAIKIMDDRLVSEYLLYELRVQGHSLGFDRGLRSSLENMREKVSVNIPIDEHDEFDIGRQKEIAEKSEKLQRIKDEVSYKIDELTATNSKITKKFCKENKGEIPVYGCSKSEDVVLGYIDNNLDGVNYYQDSLAWNRNGSVGHVFYRKGMFSTNEDHRVLTLKEHYDRKIDLFYVKYVLENEIKKGGYGFSNKLGKSKMANIEIRVPVNEQGQIGIERQVELRNEYEKINELKHRVVQQLQNIQQVDVEIT